MENHDAQSSVKVSVIIPIFNNEKYLRHCISSVIGQSLKEIEIFLIDDGSTDDAPQICDEFAATDERIIVIHKDNEGSAAARNQGINLAKGKYIAFVESDDYVAEKIYEELFKRAEETEADIVKCGFFRCRENEVPDEYADFYGLGKEGELFKAKERPYIFQCYASIWGGLYSREFLNRNNIRFIVTPRATYSDYSFMAWTYAYADKLTVLHKPLYYYTMDNGESSTSKQGKYYKYMLFHAEEANRILREAGIYSAVVRDISLQTFKTCIDGTAFGVSPDNRDDYYSLIKKLFQDMFDGIDIDFIKDDWIRRVIRQVIQGDMDSFFQELFNKFHLEDINEFCDKQVVLFGAGTCGMCYHEQLEEAGIGVCKWIDNHPKEGWNIELPNTILNENFDLILIAIKNRTISATIKKQLTDMNIPESKISFG